MSTNVVTKPVQINIAGGPLGCIKFTAVINVPVNRDSEEYIDMFLEGVLSESFDYDWTFA